MQDNGRLREGKNRVNSWEWRRLSEPKIREMGPGK